MSKPIQVHKNTVQMAEEIKNISYYIMDIKL